MIEKIISVHIPKTAGTTFKSYLDLAYKNNVVTISSKPLFRRCEIDKKQNNNNLDISLYNEFVIHGHFTFDDITYNENYFYITWLRDPVERVISHYYFWKNRPDIHMHPIEEMIKRGELSLVEFAQIPCIRNLGLYFLGKQEIEKINFIGITELFDESMQILEQKLGTQLLNNNIVNQRVNVKKDLIPFEIRKEIKEQNLEEYALYNVLKNRIRKEC